MSLSLAPLSGLRNRVGSGPGFWLRTGVLAGVLAMIIALGVVVMKLIDSPPSGWKVVYREDFTTLASLGSFRTANRDKWYLEPSNPYAQSLRVYPDGWGTTGDLGDYYPSRNLDVVAEADGASGVLRLNAHAAEIDGDYRALGAAVWPVINPNATGNDQVAQIYGRYTVRFRTSGGFRPNAQGKFDTKSLEAREQYGTAFLLWPVSEVWAEGEVNFPEMAWGSTISGFVHQIGKPEINTTEIRTDVATDAGWNVATIEWYPGVLAFYLNDELVGRTTKDVPTTAFRWGFQSGPMLNWRDPARNLAPGPDVTGTLLIDWIQIEAYRGATPPPA